jgi:histidinol-phosphatase
MGDFTLQYFDRDIDVERKQDGTPVTAADRGAEELGRKLVEESFPDDAILGEEHDDKPGTSGWQWIFDPIDGTKSFIHGVPIYSNLVGVQRLDSDGKARPEIGVIWIPALGRGVWGGVGAGAWEIFNDEAKTRPARVSKVDKLEDALFLTTDRRDFDQVGREGAYDELENKCRLTRTWGDAYGYYLVATGRAEIMIDPFFEIWDASPMLTIFREAGGAFCSWNGDETIEGGDGMATNLALRDEVVSILKRYPKTKAPQS